MLSVQPQIRLHVSSQALQFKPCLLYAVGVPVLHLFASHMPRFGFGHPHLFAAKHLEAPISILGTRLANLRCFGNIESVLLRVHGNELHTYKSINSFAKLVVQIDWVVFEPAYMAGCGEV